MASTGEAGKGPDAQSAAEQRVTGRALDSSPEVERVQIGPAARAQTGPIVGEATGDGSMQAGVGLSGCGSHPTAELELDRTGVVVETGIQETEIIGGDPLQTDAA